MLTDDERMLAKAGWRNLSLGRQFLDTCVLVAAIVCFVGGVLLVAMQVLLGMVLLFLMCVLFPVYFGARDGFVRRARERQCCIACGYSLIGIPRDTIGDGTCPECGAPFNDRIYV